MKPMHALAWGALLLTVTIASDLAFGSAARWPQGQPVSRQPFAGILDEHPAIRYADGTATDRVARLAAALAAGTQTLTYEEPGGYLRSLLRALDISPESQLLVFSKTGIQRASTGPRNPRALYFNDSVVVGYIAGARLIEIAAHDPALGVIFYTVDQARSSGADVSRRTNCLTCHVSGSTLDVPGLITRSNFTNALGEVIPQLGFHVVDHRTPLAQRWGGWFVTGRYDLAPYGGVTHMGNVATALHPTADREAGTSNEILFRWLEADATALGYASHESDIAALMVFDHQMRAINLLTRLNWESRVAAHDGRADFTRGELRKLADEVADYFLFVGEAPPPARLTPRAGFATQFTGAGPKDARGRSLRELDLTSRLLKYPCSYMIYSQAFDNLPAAAKLAVYQRIHAVLTSTSTGASTHLSAADRQAILEILNETKGDWPKAFTPRARRL
jgi:hypothetical protein